MKTEPTPETTNPVGDPEVTLTKTPFQRFEDLTKALMGVSKSEVKEQEAKSTPSRSKNRK